MMMITIRNLVIVVATSFVLCGCHTTTTTTTAFTIGLRHHHHHHHHHHTTTTRSHVPPRHPVVIGCDSTTTSVAATIVASETCQLAQLSKHTILSIDSGDIELIQQYAATGYLTDATTNPLFVAQTAFKTSSSDSDSDSIYSQMVNDAVMYAVQHSETDDREAGTTVALAMDRLAVNLGATIASIPGLTTGYISTEVDPRLSFNVDASVERALRLVNMYETDYQIGRDRILIKLAATWEGIMTAKILREQYNIQCNLTLIFSVVQGIACAQYNVHLISPFPGRILDYYNAKLQRSAVDQVTDDEGVMVCTYLYQYFKYHNHTTICMPASWRPSRGGKVHDLDEIQALCGTDRMTIPVPLLSQLIHNEEPLPRTLFPSDPASPPPPLPSTLPAMPEFTGPMKEEEFRYLLTMDACGNDKLAEGLRSFCQLTEQLEMVMTDKVRAYSKK